MDAKIVKLTVSLYSEKNSLFPFAQTGLLKVNLYLPLNTLLNANRVQVLIANHVQVLIANHVQVLIANHVQVLIANPLQVLIANHLQVLIANHVQVLIANRVQVLIANPLQVLIANHLQVSPTESGGDGTTSEARRLLRIRPVGAPWRITEYDWLLLPHHHHLLPGPPRRRPRSGQVRESRFRSILPGTHTQAW